MKAVLCLVIFLSCSAYGDESSSVVDREKVFPVQKNPLIVHSQKKDEVTKGLIVDDSSHSDPKDTKLNINGNGGSTTRPAGGKATLIKRIPLD